VLSKEDVRNKESMLEVLRNSQWFGICKEGIETFLFRNLKKGEEITEQIDGIAYAGIVSFGSVMVFSTADDGTQVALSLLEAGEIFGVANLYSQERLVTHLYCQEETSIIFIPKRHFVKCMAQDEELFMLYIKMCNEKIHFLLEKIGMLTMQNSKRKLIQFLFSKEKEGHIQLECSREELAKRLGISRATLFRDIAWLQNRKSILVEGKNLYITDEDALAKILFGNNTKIV
jgi:cAMP-binding proteins - catabolite gene activator and regulatory subunit of cAMP-dependent protein kinases